MQRPVPVNRKPFLVAIYLSNVVGPWYRIYFTTKARIRVCLGLQVTKIVGRSELELQHEFIEFVSKGVLWSWAGPIGPIFYEIEDVCEPWGCLIVDKCFLLCVGIQCIAVVYSYLYFASFLYLWCTESWAPLEFFQESKSTILRVIGNAGLGCFSKIVRNIFNKFTYIIPTSYQSNWMNFVINKVKFHSFVLTLIAKQTSSNKNYYLSVIIIVTWLSSYSLNIILIISGNSFSWQS